MKFSARFGILTDMRIALQFGFLPTLAGVARDPRLLLHPRALSRLFMSHVWFAFGTFVDENGRPTKQKLLLPARGVVLEIGAGVGHTANYLVREQVTTYIALEPNTHMHARLRATAAAAGYTESDGSLVILGCGAEDVCAHLAATHDLPAVDTLVSILTLCSVPDPQRTVRALVRDVLKPGGQFMFYEHVLSRRADVAWWQRFWTPLWSRLFDGCVLDCPADRYIADAGPWSERDVWGKEGEDPENLFWHEIGRFVKEE